MVAVSTSSEGCAAAAAKNDGSPTAAAAPPAAMVTAPAESVLTVMPAPFTMDAGASSESIQLWNCVRASAAGIFIVDANAESINVRSAALVSIAMSQPVRGQPVRRAPVYPCGDPHRRRPHPLNRPLHLEHPLV